MPIQNLECQLVRAQVNRYLGGEVFSSEAMRQLEIHLVACEDCKLALAPRKAELRAKLSPASAKAATSGKPDFNQPNIPGPNGKGPLKMPKAAVNFGAFQSQISPGLAAVAQLTRGSASGAAAGPVSGPVSGPASGQTGGVADTAKVPATAQVFSKPIILTFALAAVLLVMSRFTSSGGFPFGGHADHLFPSDPSGTAKPAASQVSQNPSPAAPSTATPATGVQSAGAQSAGAQSAGALSPGTPTNSLTRPVSAPVTAPGISPTPPPQVPLQGPKTEPAAPTPGTTKDPHAQATPKATDTPLTSASEPNPSSTTPPPDAASKNVANPKTSATAGSATIQGAAVAPTKPTKTPPVAQSAPKATKHIAATPAHSHPARSMKPKRAPKPEITPIDEAPVDDQETSRTSTERVVRRSVSRRHKHHRVRRKRTIDDQSPTGYVRVYEPSELSAAPNQP